MSISDGLGPSIICRKMKKARPMREDMIGKKLFISRQSWHLYFDVLIHKVLFPICTLVWRVNNCVSHQEKV